MRAKNSIKSRGFSFRLSAFHSSPRLHTFVHPFMHPFMLLCWVSVFTFSCVSDSSDGGASGQNEADLKQTEASGTTQNSGKEKQRDELLDDPITEVIGEAAVDSAQSGNTGNISEDVSKPAAVSTVQLELPEFFERADLDRFLRTRRTLYVNHLPLEPKFALLHENFESGIFMDQEAEAHLKFGIYEDVRRSHWVFIHGLFELMNKITDKNRPLLREQQKKMIVHYMKTLNFMAKTLDEKTKNERYQALMKRVYVTLAGRYLYREVRNRPMPKRIQTAPLQFDEN